MKQLVFLASLTTLSACSTASKEIKTAYVSPLSYQTYNCAQVGFELRRVQSRLTTIGASLDGASRFSFKKDDDARAEYAALKGEYEALQQVGVNKCYGPMP